MSFARKLKRKQMNQARKNFMKEFKKTMKKFKKLVRCSSCDREPYPGENIDQWRIDKESENIDLTCTDCFEEESNSEVHHEV